MILREFCVSKDDVAGFEAWVGGRDDGRDGVVGDGLVEWVAGCVEASCWAHAASLVGVEGEVVCFYDEAAGGKGQIEVEFGRGDD